MIKLLLRDEVGVSLTKESFLAIEIIEHKDASFSILQVIDPQSLGDTNLIMNDEPKYRVQKKFVSKQEALDFLNQLNNFRFDFSNSALFQYEGYQIINHGFTDLPVKIYKSLIDDRTYQVYELKKWYRVMGQHLVYDKWYNY